ncbi:hypothetical protein [Chryseobacterium vrystaatense]|uniref:FAD-binding FR-type domain-containing protein n=1 Tax=Chryseobacterium vrystaatense TaxID=307480 RepID=A0ABR4UM03_9FLAO|nr:hypothetical protein [Chryseobacterium vrystaatense]KFF25848.1 hypothetical protein IW16_13330 [Chryseobacterium vrystaatense]
MNSKIKTSDFFMGIILSKNKIAENTFHIRVQSRDFSQIQYTAGCMAEFFLSNPYYSPCSEAREYAFWNYEPVYHTADFAVNIKEKDKAADWIKAVEEGDTVFFRNISGQLMLDDSGSHYFLIGDSKALSYLYEINRALAVSKKVDSLIYTERNEELFSDLDHSFPLTFYLIDSLKPEKIIEIVKQNFPETSKNTIVYILGNTEISSLISNYLQGNSFFDIRKIYLKDF